MKRAARSGAVLLAAAVLMSLGFASASASGGHGAPAVPTAAKPAAVAAVGNPRPPARPEALFVPVRPCRIADTRRHGGRFRAGWARSVRVRGTVGFAPQGGASGGYGIPAGATAIAASVTSSGTTADGHLIDYPAGTPAPSTFFSSCTRGQARTTNPVLPLAPIGVDPALTIKNVGGTPDVIIDVTGYWQPQIEGMVDRFGQIFAGSSRLVSAAHLGVGLYAVTVDGDVTNCTPTVTGFSGHVYASAFGFAGNTVNVSTWTLDTTTHAEVATDMYLYLSVAC
jgi:hypothetical protein